jgi:hypothetical protein
VSRQGACDLEAFGFGYRWVTARRITDMTKAPLPSISKGVGAFVVAVTVGFEPIAATL